MEPRLLYIDVSFRVKTRFPFSTQVARRSSTFVIFGDSHNNFDDNAIRQIPDNVLPW